MGNYWEKWNQKYVYFIIVTLCVYLSMRFLVPIFFPFLFAFIYVAKIYPKLQKIHSKVRISKGFLAAFFLLIGFIILGGVLLLIVGRLVEAVGTLLSNFGNINEELIYLLRRSCDQLGQRSGIDAYEMEQMILEKIEYICECLQVEVAPKLMGESVAYLKGLGSILAYIVVTFISVIFLTKDYDVIVEFLNKQKQCQEGFHIINKITHLIAVFAKAQFIIFLVIATICSVGFFIMRSSSPIILGIVTGFLDFLPFIGTSIMLIPMAIIAIIKEQYFKAIGCILIYIACALSREALEPKLIGQKMGILPVGILLSIFAGIKLYGLGGIVLGPLSLLLILEIMKLYNQKVEAKKDDGYKGLDLEEAVDKNE